MKDKKKNNSVRASIDTSAIEKATKKADELIKKLNECIKLIHQLSGLAK